MTGDDLGLVIKSHKSHEKISIINKQKLDVYEANQNYFSRQQIYLKSLSSSFIFYNRREILCFILVYVNN